MIVTITANPSLDVTMAVSARPNGDVQRARWVLVEPSGKGINVAIALHRTGRDVLAVLPLGHGYDLAAMLAELDVRHVGVDVTGHIRTNVTLVEDDGTTSKVNEVGAALTPHETTTLVEASMTHSRAGDWLAWCGSLPAGFDGKRLADAVAAARQDGRIVALDTSQAALTTVLDSPADELPHLIKPNAAELAELTGRGFATLGEVAGAAHELVERGVETVLVSLGADGALLVDRYGAARHGTAVAERVVNTAGAGDSFLAGYLWAVDGARTSTADERLASALRFGAAAVAQPGTLFAPPTTFALAHIGVVDRDRPLSEPVPEPTPLTLPNTREEKP